MPRILFSCADFHSPLTFGKRVRQWDKFSDHCGLGVISRVGPKSVKNVISVAVWQCGSDALLGLEVLAERWLDSVAVDWILFLLLALIIHQQPVPRLHSTVPPIHNTLCVSLKVECTLMLNCIGWILFPDLVALLQ